MPLVIAVLVILVIIFNAKDSIKNNARQSSIREKDRRKTNARLEQRVLDTYMKHGWSFEDAFRQSYEDMIAAGYDPCIPKNAYDKNEGSVESSSYRGNIGEYDSFLVRERRRDAERQWQQSHPGVSLTHATEEEIDALTYSNFPKTEFQYLHDLNRMSMRTQAEPVGSFIIYPGLGTCEVLAHNWIGDGAAGGRYTLRVLRTGEIVEYVKIGDSKIRRQ